MRHIRANRSTADHPVGWCGVVVERDPYGIVPLTPWEWVRHTSQKYAGLCPDCVRMATEGLVCEGVGDEEDIPF